MARVEIVLNNLRSFAYELANSGDSPGWRRTRRPTVASYSETARIRYYPQDLSDVFSSSEWHDRIGSDDDTQWSNMRDIVEEFRTVAVV